MSGGGNQHPLGHKHEHVGEEHQQGAPGGEQLGQAVSGQHDEADLHLIFIVLSEELLCLHYSPQSML